MEMFKHVSIRGRIAYLICSFEKLLLHYDCDINDWKALIEKLWSYTSIEFLDDWLYELAEYMPNTILEDNFEDAEYITIDEFVRYKKIYKKTNHDVLIFLEIIFKCGTYDLYSKLYNYSPDTLYKMKEAINILNKNNIDLVDVEPFKKYVFNVNNGWGDPFDGDILSVIINNF